MKYTNVLFSSSLGNILEWYDFGLFTIFSSLFSRLFFPNEDPYVATIATIGIFAVGFICRPIGALIFGYLGDREGRAKTIRLSILVIALPTFLIGLLPTYNEIHLAAPILLLLVRIAQGISIGGEYTGNMIYLAEFAPPKHRGLFTSFASSGANIGILLAALVGLVTSYFLSDAALENWGWRLPYLISGFVCILLYWYRLKMQETMVFEQTKRKHELPSNPIKTVFHSHFPQLLLTLGLVCMGSTFYYFCFIYLPIFLRQESGFSIYQISMLMTTLLMIMVVLTPIAGFISDRIGRRKMLLFNSTLIILILVPGYYLLHFREVTLIIFVMSLFTIASAFEQGTTLAALVENFPPPARYTGISFGYSLGNGLLGGTVPMIYEWLATRSILLPAVYVMCCACITCLVVFLFVREARYIESPRSVLSEEAVLP